MVLLYTNPGNCQASESVAFIQQRQAESLDFSVVIWYNGRVV